MNRAKYLFTSILLGGLACCAIAIAQAPVVNIDAHRHGALAAAQSAIVDAYQKIDAAQHANKEQLGGHAEKAKQFLVQADAELRLAANAAGK